MFQHVKYLCTKHIAILGILLALPSFASAQWLQHHVNLYGEGAYAGRKIVADDVNMGGNGMNFAIGLAYELEYNHFLLNIGLDGNFVRTTNKYQDLSLKFPNITDTENEQFTLEYLLGNRRDITTSWRATLPILIGAKFESFYFLVGPRAGLQFVETETSHSEVTTYGHYIWDIQPVTDYDVKGLRSVVPVQTPHKHNKLLPYVGLHGEIGFELPVTLETGQKVMRVRLAAIGDYSLLKMHTSSDNEVTFDLDPRHYYDFSYISLNPYLSTKEAADVKVHNFTVGAKITFAFGDNPRYSGLHRSKRHCNCENRWDQEDF